MRPTVMQLYTDPMAFVVALEAAGVESAHAKVMGLMRQVCEFVSMVKYTERLDSDRTYTHQQHTRRRNIPAYKPDPVQRRSNIKAIAEYNKTLIPARGYVRRTQIKLDARIAKWPDLDIDPATLRKKPDHALINRLLKKRRNRGRRRTVVLG